jgi:hypothetical protein
MVIERQLDALEIHCVGHGFFRKVDDESQLSLNLPRDSISRPVRLRLMLVPTPAPRRYRL